MMSHNLNLYPEVGTETRDMNLQDQIKKVVMVIN